MRAKQELVIMKHILISVLLIISVASAALAQSESKTARYQRSVESQLIDLAGHWRRSTSADEDLLLTLKT